MELEGKVWKDPNSSWWLIEIPFLDVMTQGKTQNHAIEMIKDAVNELLIDSGSTILTKHFHLTVNLYANGVIGMGATDQQLLLDLGLKRQKLSNT